MNSRINITDSRYLIEQVHRQIFESGIPEFGSSFASGQIPYVESSELWRPGSPKAALISRQATSAIEHCQMRLDSHSTGVRGTPNTCLNASLVPNSMVLLGSVIVAVATDPLDESAMNNVCFAGYDVS